MNTCYEKGYGPKLLRNSALNFVLLLALFPLLVSGTVAAGAEKIGDSALQQIQTLQQEKESRTPAQQKLVSQLIFAMKQSRNEACRGRSARQD